MTVDSSGNGIVLDVGSIPSSTTPILLATTLDARHNDQTWPVTGAVTIKCPAASLLNSDFETALVAEHASGFTLDLPTAADLTVPQHNVVSLMVKNGNIRVIGPSRASIG